MNLFFFDESNNLTDIKKLGDLKIITFDHKSHILLKNNQIKHQISDEFLDEATSKEITSKNYQLIQWYNLDIIKEKLTFHGVNIPKLFTDEFTSSLLKILKKVIEIQNILKKYPHMEIITSNELYDITKIFSTSIFKIEKNNNEKFYFDEINTSFTIGNKKINFKISNKKYQRLKQILENIFSVINMNKVNPTKNFTLILELNIEHFKNFLIESSKKEMPISYYGRRRPAIWNKNTFNIIRKSNCNVISKSNIMEKNHEIEVKKITEKYLKIINEILEEKILENYFNIFDICIWSIVKKKIKELMEPRLKLAIEEIILGENLLKKNKPNTIIMISEAGRSEQIISTLAKKYDDIDILHLQEGAHCDTQEAFENTFSQGVYPILADKYIVWGDTYKQDAIEVGKIEKSKIEVLGSPRFENLKFEQNQNHEEYVLLATMPPQIEQIGGLNVKNLENYKKSIIRICEIVTNMNKKMKIKLHPAVEILDLPNLIKNKFSGIEVIYQGDINPLIRNCSELIVTGTSTVIIQGQILKKPVISIPLIEYYWGEPSVYKSKSCIVSKIEELDSTLNKLTNDLEFRKNLIKNADMYLKSCITNKESSSEKIWEYIKNREKQKGGI